MNCMLRILSLNKTNNITHLCSKLELEVVAMQLKKYRQFKKNILAFVFWKNMK
jgi:hypothetical protein